MENNYLISKLIRELTPWIFIKSHTFKKNESITSYITNRNYIFILLQGEADLVHYEINGSMSIIEHFSKNTIFGDAFHSFHNSNELVVVAKKKCHVLSFDYREILRMEQLNFKEINTIISQLMFNKIAMLNHRITLLTRRTIREKLLSYFAFNSTRQYSRTFTLTVSYTDLAQYLSVDRSAMMREISHLIDDGIIYKSGREISLLV